MAGNVYIELSLSDRKVGLRNGQSIEWTEKKDNIEYDCEVTFSGYKSRSNHLSRIFNQVLFRPTFAKKKYPKSNF